MEAAFVCRHLAARIKSTGPKIGMIRAENTPERQAWCSACDDVLMEHGGEWNDQSEGFAHVTFICSGCFDSLLRLERS